MKVLAFGEILFDIFGASEKIGGAPFNFCADLVQLGVKGYMLSALGTDRLGRKALTFLKDAGIGDTYTNSRSSYPTGFCEVTVGEDGEPVYRSAENVAYDHITLTDRQLDAICSEHFDVFYFGTIAQRCETSRRTLSQVLNSCTFREIFFDLNIRLDYYDANMIRDGLAHATILKVNFSECRLLGELGLIETLLPDKNDSIALLAAARELCGAYRIKTVVITLDKDGAAAYRDDTGEYFRGGIKPGRVVSAVGAGDAFSAGFIYNYISGRKLPLCVERANLLGCYTVEFMEAIPPYTEELLQAVVD